MHTGENGSDPRDEIVRPEAHIDELAAKIENCRKFILAARVATWGGGVVLVAMLVGAIRLDPATMAGASAALRFWAGAPSWRQAASETATTRSLTCASGLQCSRN